VALNMATNITSVSIDGKLCQWKLATSSTAEWTPTLSLDLKWDKHDVNITCLAVFGEEILVGSESGFVFQVSKTDGVFAVVGTKHDGPVTSLSFNPRTKLLVSSSLDWTCRVTSLLSLNSSNPVSAKTGATTAPHKESLVSLGNYVAESRFSPTHPGVFASVDADGKLVAWMHEKGFWSAFSTCSASPYAIRKLCWSREGDLLVTGTTRGVVRVWDLKSSDLMLRGSSAERERERVQMEMNL